MQHLKHLFKNQSAWVAKCDFLMHNLVAKWINFSNSGCFGVNIFLKSNKNELLVC